MPGLFALVTDAYYVSDTDQSSAGPNYFGYTSPYGSWLIMKVTITGNVQTYTYARGNVNSAYATAWTNRASQSYSAVAGAFG